MSLAKKANMFNVGRNIKSSGRKVGGKLDTKELKIIKQMHKQKVEYEYRSSYGRDMQYDEYELHLFNHKGWICGYLDDDFTSADHILMRCAQRQPKGILLGDLGINDFEIFNLGLEKYMKPPHIEPISGENLLGRQLFMDYFRNNFPTNMHYYKTPTDYTIYEVDNNYKRRIFNASLTLSYYACFREQTKIIFSSPNKLLNLEDLVINYRLEELQVLFVQALQEYVKRAEEEQFTPRLTPPEILTMLKRIVQETQTEKLYDKKCQYSAAVFKKIHKLFPKNILFMPHYLVSKTYEHITDSFCPDFDEVYRTKDFKQKLKDSKTDLNTLEEIIEKLCILSYLVDKEVTHYIMNGQNPLKVMFGGKYAHFPDQKVFEIFGRFNSIYQSEIENLFFGDLKRINKTASMGRYWTKDYTEEVKKWEKGSEISKILPESKFIIDKFRKQEEMKFINQLLLTQIGININLKEMNGQNMNIVKSHLGHYISGYKTKQNSRLFDELLIEANAQLGLLKLPSSYRKYETKLNEVLYQKLEDVLGEDPQKVYERAISKIYNQLQGIDPFIVKDGSEAEMKDSILNKNEKSTFKLKNLPNYLFNRNNETEKNKDIFKNFKSLNPNKQKQSLYSKFNDMAKELKNKEEKEISNSSSTDLATINLDQEDEETKNKLEIIQELKLALEEEEGKSIISMNENLNLDLFKNKSIEELKQMDIEEVATINLEGDEEGNMKYNIESYKDNEIEKLEKDMTTGGRSSIVDLSEQRPEKNYFSVYGKIVKDLVNKDKERSKNIANALMTGQYIDDPVYVHLLMNEERFIKQREKFLKKYFTSGKKITNPEEKAAVDKLKNTPMPLLDKYATKPGDILDNMIKDDIFYKYDHSIGKTAFNLYDRFLEELEEEEKDLSVAQDPDKFTNDLADEQEEEEEVIDNMHEFIKDKISELHAGVNKSLYLENIIKPKKNEGESSVSMSTNYKTSDSRGMNSKGRHIKVRNNKKLNML